MKRSTLVLSALLALCAVVRSGCDTFEYLSFRREKGDVAEQPDGTWVHVYIQPSQYVDEERKQIRQRDPYRIHFAIWGYFEAIESIDAWVVLNGEKTPFLLDLERMNAGRVTATRGDKLIFPSEPDFILNTSWESIETLKLHIRFTAKVDGVERKYDIVTPLTKDYRERKSNPFWDAMMSV